HAGVEAAFMRVVEAALQRRALVGLAVAAVGVVGDEAGVGGEGAVFGRDAAGTGQGGAEDGKRWGDRGLVHGLLLGRGVGMLDEHPQADRVPAFPKPYVAGLAAVPEGVFAALRKVSAHETGVVRTVMVHGLPRGWAIPVRPSPHARLRA